MPYDESSEFIDNDQQVNPPKDIVAYNELRSCADLYRMFKTGKLNIQPEFQRDVVWDPSDQTRFIDSLMKQLPIPSMCFSLDYNTGEWQVIDGLQRMTSIIKFLQDDAWKLSDLSDVNPEIANTYVRDIRYSSNDKVKLLYERVENLTLPVTIIRCDYLKQSHQNYLFTIFHRLNAGGARLNNQEIRNCIFSGKFNTLLKKLNEVKEWKQIIKYKTEKQNRYTKIEMILRFFAFYYALDVYSGGLAGFLNDFMHENRNPTDAQLMEYENIFNRTIKGMAANIPELMKGKFSNTFIHTLMHGYAKNISHLEDPFSSNRVHLYFERLSTAEVFTGDDIKYGVDKRVKFNTRLKKAEEIFSGIENASGH